MPFLARLQNFSYFPPILVHCSTGIDHEILDCWRYSASEPDRGHTALRLARPLLGAAVALAAVAFGAVCVSYAARAAEPAILLLGRGVQIYACTRTSQSYAWRLKAPDAVLLDASGAVAGHHFAGPTWQAADGSAVVGAPLVSSPAPQAGSVPWLVLNAKSHTGAGRFADVAYVVRSQTEGGAAPASGCDAGHAGGEVRVGYQATYLFFPGAAAK